MSESHIMTKVIFSYWEQTRWRFAAWLELSLCSFCQWNIDCLGRSCLTLFYLHFQSMQRRWRRDVTWKQVPVYFSLVSLWPGKVGKGHCCHDEAARRVLVLKQSFRYTLRTQTALVWCSTQTTSVSFSEPSMRWLGGKVSLWGPKRPAIEVPQSLEMSWQFNFGWRRTLARIFQVLQRLAGNQVVQGSYQTKSKVRRVYVFSSNDSMCFLSKCQFQNFFPAYSTQHTTHYLHTILEASWSHGGFRKRAALASEVPHRCRVRLCPAFCCPFWWSWAAQLLI